MIVISVITSLIHIVRAGVLKDLCHTVVIPTAVSGELLRTHMQTPEFLEANWNRKQ